MVSALFGLLRFVGRLQDPRVQDTFQVAASLLVSPVHELAHYNQLRPLEERTIDM